jgi:DNA ligase 1
MSFTDFSQLIVQLDGSNSKLLKVQLLSRFFKLASAEDATWAVFFLSGRRLKRHISSRVLREVFLTLSGLPDWLYGEAYLAAGDTAETISLLSYQLSPAISPVLLQDYSLADVMTHFVLPMSTYPDLSEHLHNIWSAANPFDVFVYNKLLLGAFRIGVSQGLVVQALSDVTELDAGLIQHRLMGHWQPTATFFQQLTSLDASTTSDTQPYPFYLASPLEHTLAQLPVVWPQVDDWQLEWKWDGIRGQLIQRNRVRALWSRGEDLVTERFPELMRLNLPDGTVLDGEILAWHKEYPLPFAKLQQRIGRQNITQRILDEIPVIFLAYDVLEYEGRDIRPQPLHERRQLLATLVKQVNQPDLLQLSDTLVVDNWQQAADWRAKARDMGVEGLMIKHRQSPYRTGRKKGDWWKWKLEPYTMDAVMTMAQVGHGKRGNRFTDYTFAIFNDQRELVPIAKAYSGLTDVEILQVDKWIRQHTVAKFGPVRQVPPVQVFELGFEGIAVSNRHKAGLAVRFPRILRWRQDKPVEEIDTVATLTALMPNQD